MKHILLPCLLIALLAGCTKEKPVDPSEPTPPVDTTTHIIELGKGSVSRNGTPWDAVFSAQYFVNNKSRFVIKASLKENGFDHSLKISDISTAIGVQNIERPNFWNGNNGVPHVYYFVYLDLDQEINTYKGDSTRSNQYIELLRYDSINHIVEGRFQTFLEGPNTWWFLPDSMAMTEGKFHLKIQ
jgi:hypothetical protein